MVVEKTEILTESDVPPFQLDAEATEALRLKYRYLELRRPQLQQNLVLRHKLLFETRKFFHEKSFIEVETPFLYKSTPEGARDYLVPSRLQKGSFYALPQSPQTLKQLLMIARFDRYYQIVKCFRDEDMRADRQTEFTQLDMEMSFPTIEHFYALMEDYFQTVFKNVLGYSHH